MNINYFLINNWCMQALVGEQRADESRKAERKELFTAE
jgi:hypothetical protein